MNAKEKWFVAIAFFYIAYMVFPIVSSITRIPIWMMCSAISVVLLLFYSNCIKQRFLLWFFLYFSVLLIYCLVGHTFHINGIGDSNPAFRRLTIEIAWILPNLLISAIAIKLNNHLIYKLLGAGIICLLVVSLLTLLPTLLSYGRILRENSTSIAKGEGELAEALPGYTLMSCYAYFVPVLCYGFKVASRVPWKLVFIAFIAIFVYAIIKTEITTSFIAIVILLVFTLFYNGRANNKSSLLIVLFAGALFIWALYASGALLRFVEMLVDLYQGTSAQTKFIEFQGMLSGSQESGNISLRRYLRQMSLNCFYENPFIGSPGVGEHSSLVDRLGSMGLLGFLPYLFMLISNVRSWIDRMPELRAKHFFLSGIAIVFMFLYMKGLFGGEGMLFMTVLLPVSIIGLSELFIPNKNS